jgi:FkbM family methyltransferase
MARLDNINRSLEVVCGVTSRPSEPVAFRPFAYFGDHIGLATTEVGFRIFVDTRDRQIAPHLATVGIWEPWNTNLLEHLLRPGDTVVEIGANFGFFTILGATLVGNTGRVIAFEANPDLASLLAASVQINGLEEQVDIRNLAVTDSRGEVEFAVYKNFLGDGHILPLHAVRHADQRLLRVPADKLDNQLQRVDDIRLLRLDAEGAEPAILRGAQAVIARSPRLVILMEWGLGTAGLTRELEALAAEGFVFYTVQHDGALRETASDALAAAPLCDILCYRGEVTEFARRVE